MFSLTSLGRFELNNAGTVFIVESPVKADRNFKALRAALGNVVEIDGSEYEPVGFEMKMPGSPVSIGEKIGILVRSRPSP